jgi:hypothetical protein
MATTVVKPKQETLEAVADSFVRELIHKRGFEAISLTCVGDNRKAQVPSHEDVHAFLKTLDQDAAIRFDASETDTEVPLNVEPEEPEIDLDLDQERLILARRIGHKQIYFSGIHERSKRLLWTYDPRLAHCFHGHADVIRTVFQFQEPGDLVLEDVFAGLGLTLMAPSPTPSF